MLTFISFHYNFYFLTFQLFQLHLDRRKGWKLYHHFITAFVWGHFLDWNDTKSTGRQKLWMQPTQLWSNLWLCYYSCQNKLIWNMKKKRVLIFNCQIHSITLSKYFLLVIKKDAYFFGHKAKKYIMNTDCIYVKGKFVY